MLDKFTHSLTSPLAGLVLAAGVFLGGHVKEEPSPMPVHGDAAGLINQI